MRQSTRLLILTAVVEVLLVLGTIFMLHQVTTGAWPTFDQAEAGQRITTVMGMAIGGFGAAALFVAFLMRRKGN